MQSARFLILLLVVLIAPWLGGCNDVLGVNAITQERQTIADGYKTVMLKVTDAVKIEGADLRADGKVVNPAYKVTMFAGAGTFAEFTVSATGVEISGGVNGHGNSSLPEPDTDLRQRIDKILNQTELSEQARKDKIADAFAAWLKSKANPSTSPIPSGSVPDADATQAATTSKPS